MGKALAVSLGILLACGGLAAWIARSQAHVASQVDG
jgi:hypothetical protein